MRIYPALWSIKNISHTDNQREHICKSFNRSVVDNETRSSSRTNRKCSISFFDVSSWFSHFALILVFHIFVCQATESNHPAASYKKPLSYSSLSSLLYSSLFYTVCYFFIKVSGRPLLFIWNITISKLLYLCRVNSNRRIWRKGISANDFRGKHFRFLTVKRYRWFLTLTNKLLLYHWQELQVHTFDLTRQTRRRGTLEIILIDHSLSSLFQVSWNMEFSTVRCFWIAVTFKLWFPSNI